MQSDYVFNKTQNIRLSDKYFQNSLTPQLIPLLVTTQTVASRCWGTRLRPTFSTLCLCSHQYSQLENGRIVTNEPCVSAA